METSFSPLHQMSFETTVRFLTQAALYGHTDSLKSASSRLVVGRPVREGTGITECVELLQPVSEKWDEWANSRA